MKPLQIAICDDLEEERVILSRMLRNYARRQGLSLQVHFFVSGEELLQSVRRANAGQVLFLDIYMPGISGVETARRLRAAGYGASIVFATTSTDHGVDSFEVRASDYLVKPFRQEEVDRALDWCLEHMPEPLRLRGGGNAGVSSGLRPVHRSAGPPIPHPHPPPDCGGAKEPGRPGARR